jgi:predicted lipoprotein with Yx(FWY)xxD motif
MVQMIRTRVVILAAFLAAGSVALTACGPGSYGAATPAPATGTSASTSVDNSAATGNLTSAINYVGGTAQANNAPANTGDFYSGPSNSPVAMKWVQLSAGSAGSLNPVVLNGAGFTLYRFDKDTPHPSVSNCNGACAVTWPPVLVQPGGRIFVDGVSKADVGTVRRADGTLQVTIGGWPIYKFSKDTAPGQTNGQCVGGTWFGVTPTGKKAASSPQGSNPSTNLNYTNGTAMQNNAPPNTGDFFNGPSNDPAAMKWVQLTAGSANGLDPIVHNGVGFTFYRFDKDTPHPSVSNCTGACAVTWPPVLVQPGGRIFVDGVSTAEIGIITRADGTRQVTIGGWPIYRFSKDTAPGQTNGEGVGGTWFAVSPTGGKILTN